MPRSEGRSACKRSPQPHRDFPAPLGIADNGEASHERGIVRVPLEGGGRLVVSVNDAEAKELYDVLGGVVKPA
jgi:hypothetical protein